MENLLIMFLFAAIQGITEWIPVSSSGHLVLASYLLDYHINFLFLVALHFGTLAAIFVYFGKEIVEIIRDFFTFDFRKEGSKLGSLILIASLPSAIFGFFLKDFISESSGNPFLLALGFSITSLILFIGSLDFNLKNLYFSKKSAFFIGLAQVLSLFRGISRSGSTIVTALLLGFNMKDAVKFSFLISIPIVFGANILVLNGETIPKEYFFASLFSFLISLLFIHFSFTKLLANRKNLRWFAFYTLFIALSLFIHYFFVNL